MQVKVNLTMETLGKVQEDQNRVTSSLSGAGVTPLVIPEKDVNAILGPPPARQPGMPQDRPPPAPSERVHQRPLPLPASGAGPRVTIPTTPTVSVYDEVNGMGSSRGDEGRRSWFPKMDFPKFDGTDVRIWIDTCNTFFLLYNIAEGFKVSAATMYMRDSAAHWYQAYKLENPWHNWSTFSVDVIQEFEGNAQRDKIRELLTLKQTGTVEEYKRQFEKLVYQIKLYDPNMGGLMLVQRFILGLKEELRAAVEVQLPNTVAEAAMFAQIQESVLARSKQGFTRSYHKKTHKEEGDQNHPSANKFEKGEIWKAKQLKDYRRANNLCFKCGEKYAPGHVCVVPATGQLKTMQGNEILSDELLDMLVTRGEDYDCHVSLNAMSGTSQTGTIQFKTLVGDQVMLLLLDSGSSHSFVDQSLVEKLKYPVANIQTLRVKVASGDYMYCNKMVPNMQWML
jgi:hypothetical protein